MASVEQTIAQVGLRQIAAIQTSNSHLATTARAADRASAVAGRR
jgi:hypothetical protein